MEIVLTNTDEDTITLPTGLYWSDEFDWAPLTQSVTYTLTGALLIEEGTKETGRTITLEGADSEMGWAARSVVADLLTWASEADTTYTLTLDGIDYTVQFHAANDAPVEATPVLAWSDATDDDQWFTLKVHFIVVA